MHRCTVLPFSAALYLYELAGGPGQHRRVPVDTDQAEAALLLSTYMCVCMNFTWRLTLVQPRCACIVTGDASQKPLGGE